MASILGGSWASADEAKASVATIMEVEVLQEICLATIMRKYDASHTLV